MEFSARQIAELLQGKLTGDPEIKVNSLAKIEDGTAGDLSFLAEAKYLEHLSNSKASIVIVDASVELNGHVPNGCTVIEVDNARVCFAKLLQLYDQMRYNKQGIDKNASIHSSATIGEDVYIGPFVYIGENVTIGNGAKIFPNVYIGDNAKVGTNTRLLSSVSIYPECIVGDECIIHAGTAIGGDGFGFAPSSDNEQNKVAHIGNVVVGNKVEIGSNTSIDRATLGSTIIRDGVKLDNQIQIAHNVEIGENTVIAALTGVAGSTRIGKNCMIGGCVAIAGHVSIANGVMIQGHSGIPSSIKEEGMVVQGSPALPIKDYLRSYVHFRNFPDLEKRIQELEKTLAAIESSSRT